MQFRCHHTDYVRTFGRLIRWIYCPSHLNNLSSSYHYQKVQVFVTFKGCSTIYSVQHFWSHMGPPLLDMCLSSMNNFFGFSLLQYIFCKLGCVHVLVYKLWFDIQHFDRLDFMNVSNFIFEYVNLEYVNSNPNKISFHLMR